MACTKHASVVGTKEEGAASLPEKAANRSNLSAWAYDKVLRLARTLADVDDAEATADHHVSGAIQYRSLDGELF